jgi:tRNA-splicing ligase RtcB
VKVTKNEGQFPIKSWTDGVPFEDAARKQVENLASLPFIHKHVAVMPDCHKGIGSTVGSVIATKGAIIPAAVGVDIGCGMQAVRTSLKASDLPDNLHAMRTAIEAAVPHGRTDNGGPNDRGAWCNVPEGVMNAVMNTEHNLFTRYVAIKDKHPQIGHRGKLSQLGTLGTGNHFIEVCLDDGKCAACDGQGGTYATGPDGQPEGTSCRECEISGKVEPSVWIMLHSGSRGPGNKIGTYFISKAREEMRRWFINLPDVDLAYLPEGSDLFTDYMQAVGWAQDYARANRELMMQAALGAVAQTLGRKVVGTDTAVQCHHNYVERENHFGENVWVTRKGAVRARVGDLGVIPGSMGAKSFIVRGKGNPESFNSCSHGAGRKMSRTQAKKAFTLLDHATAMGNVEARLDADIIDETPGAYKSIEAVMAAQSDLVEIVATLKQVLCVKG